MAASALARAPLDLTCWAHRVLGHRLARASAASGNLHGYRGQHRVLFVLPLWNSRGASPRNDPASPPLARAFLERHVLTPVEIGWATEAYI